MRYENKKIFFAFVLGIYLLMPSFPLRAQDVSDEGGKTTGNSADELLVKYSDSIDLKDEGDLALARAISADNNLHMKEAIVEDNIAVVEKPEGVSAADAIDAISADPRVEYAQPNYVYRSMMTPNDTRFAQQWALNNANDADLDIPEAWDVSLGSQAPPIVAVIDSGVMYEHPDLSQRMWDGTNCKDENGNALGGCVGGYNFADENTDPLETTNFHGTHVSGIIAASMNDAFGVAGVAPNAKIMALKFDLVTEGAFTTAEAIRGINFAKYNGAKIINASWGGEEMDILLKNSIESFEGLFVTAAGNGGVDGLGDNNESVPIYPCNFDSPNIICVAATDNTDTLASFSNFGSSSVDVGAPGVSILSTYSDVNKAAIFANGTGTSMAVPFVSGIAALVWGNNGALSVAQVKNAILSTGDSLASLSGKTLTGKRVNAFKALGGVENPNSFANTIVSFRSGDVSGGKTKKTRVIISFSNVENAQAFMLSSRSDFAGASWQSSVGGVFVGVKKTDKKQKYYVKFRDSNGFESVTYTKTVQYYQKKMRVIRNSKDRVKNGDTLTQTGKNFSKKSDVAIYANGVRQFVVKTNKEGSFSTSFVVKKLVGAYKWYAKDLKTGKKSKSLTYKVI